MRSGYFKEIETAGLLEVLSKAQRLGFVGPEVVENHVKSSILFYQCLEQVTDLSVKTSIVDIGTGGGIPGLVIAILHKKYADSKITFIESSKRRTQFLEEAVNTLNLNATTEVFHGSTVTYLARNPNQFHKIGTARLFGSLPATLECLAPILKTPAVITISAHSRDKIIQNKAYFQACKELGIEFVEKKSLENYWFWIFRKNELSNIGYPRARSLIKAMPMFEMARVE